MATFDDLMEFSNERIQSTSLDFKRYLYTRINWDSRLIGIKGARGVGKSTLVLQYLKQKRREGEQVVYLSLDNLYFPRHSLTDTIREFRRLGVQLFVLDEVHKYPNWSAEIKFIYDQYPEISVIFTGSSIMDIAKQEFDLSRRASLYEMFGMSFREFLKMGYELEIPRYAFSELIRNPTEKFELFPSGFKPYQFFQEYLEFGYYPFYFEDKKSYRRRLNQVIRLITEYDMAELDGLDIRNAKKIQLLLSIVAESAPFKPNISKLAQKTDIHRNSIMNYIHFLEQAQLLSLLFLDRSGISALQKPEKLYLQNTNLAFALADNNPEVGNLRETFILSQLKVDAKVTYTDKGDFLVNRSTTLEVGGKNKGQTQIKDLNNAFLALDSIDSPVFNRIPLWMFGFLY